MCNVHTVLLMCPNTSHFGPTVILSCSYHEIYPFCLVIFSQLASANALIIFLSWGAGGGDIYNIYCISINQSTEWTTYRRELYGVSRFYWSKETFSFRFHLCSGSARNKFLTSRIRIRWKYSVDELKTISLTYVYFFLLVISSIYCLYENFLSVMWCF
jgi:hypothetical protein